MKINLMDKNDKINEVKLTLKDMLDLQTRETKRTAVLGIASSVASIASMVVPNRALKYGLCIIGCVGAGITLASFADSCRKVTNEENTQNTNDIINAIIHRHVALDDFHRHVVLGD